MGFVGNLLGMNGNTGGTYQAASAPLLQPTNANQIGNSYGQAQTGLAQSQGLYNALAAQNGIQNQSNVFNQLQGVANGTGPNPAMAQLANTTGQNIASQAALQAGQRGAGANVGLLARQIGQQGAATQQNAVGQAAALQANQSLGALSQLSGIAGQQVGQQQNAATGYNQAAQSEQQNLLNANAGFNTANVQNTASQNSANASIQGINAQGQQALLGGGLGGAGTGIEALFARGGVVKNYDQGGSVSGPQSSVGKFLYSSAPAQAPTSQFDQAIQPIQNMGGSSALSKGASSLSDSAFFNVGNELGIGLARGGKPLNGEMLAAQGKMVPGKAAVAGNSLRNDKVPAMLSPKEIVLPRSVTMSKDPAGNASRFVKSVLAKKGKK